MMLVLREMEEGGLMDLLVGGLRVGRQSVLGMLIWRVKMDVRMMTLVSSSLNVLFDCLLMAYRMGVFLDKNSNLLAGA